MRALVLASASPRRRELLASRGFEFTVRQPEVEEMPPGALPPRGLCMRNAALKAEVVAGEDAGSVVLAADTVVALEGVCFGKPPDLPSARSMLEKLCGRTHEVLTAVCISHGRVECRFVESTRVRFRTLAEVDLDEYLARVNPLDKAGAYAAQEDEGVLIKRVEGCFDNVVGLPVARVREALAGFGIRPR